LTCPCVLATGYSAQAIEWTDNVGKILDFLKKKEPIGEAARSRAEIVELARQHAIPALSLDPSQAGTSYIGGSPPLPVGMEWPKRGERPLTFIAGIDLGDAHKTGTIPWLPERGLLLFFYDTEEQPWGYDPKDADGWSVVLVESGVSTEETAGPALNRIGLVLREFDSLPDIQRFDDLGLNISEQEQDDWFDGDMQIGRAPFQIGGFPNPIQNDTMELECQLVSNGLYCGDLSGYEDARAAELAKGAGEWRLLLQLDSEDEIGEMWGDCGFIYFWIRESDARAGRFDKAWLVLQCS